VIAGQSHGVQAVIDTHTPIQMLHFRVQPGGRFVQAVSETHNAFAWVFGGALDLGTPAQHVTDGHMAVFGRGDEVTVEVPEDAAEPGEMLLLSGVPLREPVARYGPFVMNTKTQILEAVEDYRAGRMGRIDF